ncbi:MAG: GNAT family N-acetyltransferase [Alphaproteobacteria bacterium]|jgi:ribosomal protein S18 acetylase RimI-like enzyme|nr:GNAT family N-acetyltransferase [Alphaproteobacteria bacterium]
MSEPTIRPAGGDADLEAVRGMILAYAREFGFGLCYQGLDAELAGLPEPYAPPGGGLLLAEAAGAPVGCVAFRRLDAEACEMKRLYVAPAVRGDGLARRLCTSAMAEARRRGYRTVRLDTRADMVAAQALYRALGFAAIPAYYPDAEAGLAFFEKQLDSGTRAA